MANKTTYVLEIDAEISSLENKLKSMKGALAGVLSSAQAPKGLEKSFEKVESLLEKIRTKASQPLESGAGFASIKKDITGAGIALNNVVRIIENIGSLSEDVRISFLSPESQKEVQAIVDSLADFAEAIAASTVETKELTEAREKLAKANASIAAAEQKLITLNADLDTARQEKKTTEQAIAGIEARKKKLAELKKQQEEIEKFYNTPEADGSKKNRSKKYGDTMRPQDIRKKITDLETSMVGDEESLSNLREELKKTNGSIDSYLGRIGTAERELTEAKRSQQQLATAVTTAQQAFDSGAIEQQQNAFKALREQALKLGIALDDIGENYSPEDATKLTSKFIELKNKGLDQVTNATTQFNQTAKETGEVVEDLNKKVDESKESFEQMSEAAREQEAFENKIKQFLGMAGAAQVLRNALRNAMDTIKELDATMTEMSVVTDLSVGDYWDQLPQYTQRANELGLAINDVYKADTLFYQQGLKTNEVVAISTETMKMARIAGLDTAEATDRMTAALRGFNMELNEVSAQKISDVYSELAAITAADVDEISTAMTKTASIASSAGMEFETTAAFLSQIIETTRESAETAGTAMKTVIARFQELKKAPDEIGEIEGEIVDANAIEKALRSVGVSLRDAGGQFRELDDVFLELSSKWDTLDKNTQRYIATIAAGSRQQSRFIAMMSDYARTQELVTTATNSAGASQRQFEKTTESLETKINKLKNAWDEFTMGILESDLVKFGVDLLTKFLEIINKATSAFNGLGGSIMKIATILAIFKMGAKIFEKLRQPVMSFFGWIVEFAKPKGYETGKGWGAEFVRGAKEEIDKAKGEQKEEPKDSQEEKQKPEEQQKASIGVTIAQKSGWADINEGLKKRKKGRELRSRQINALKARQQYAAASTKYEEVASNYAEDTEEYKKAYVDLTKAQKDCAKYTDLTKEELDELAKVGKEGTEQMTKGFAKMGEAAIGAGVGISMLGGLLSSLGLEELGEGISAFGNGITMVGTAVTALIPILTVLVEFLKKKGVETSAAWIWATVIAVAVAALVVGIIAIANAVKNASPEAKLERAQEAADKAADAADRATESYENLKDSFEGLENGYKALENLTRGTEEWNDAVNNINNSVLDLIASYPALAALVENEGGVLTIDLSSDEVQSILDEAKQSAIIARNNSTMAALEVSKAEDEVAYKNLDSDAKISTSSILGPGERRGSNYDMNADEEGYTRQLAKAIASGAIVNDRSGYQIKNKAKLVELGIREEDLDRFYADVGDNTEKLREFGNQLLETEKQSEAAFGALAVSAMELANTLGFAEEEQIQATNIVDNTVVEKFYNEALESMEGHEFTHSKLDENQKKKRDEAIKAQYGANARVEGNKVIYRDAQGNQQSEELTSDEMKAITANYIATNKAADAIERTPEVLDKVGAQMGFAKDSAEREAFEVATQDKTGKNLTAVQAKKMANLSEEALTKIWFNLDDTERAIFGTYEKFIAKTKGAGEIAEAAFDDAYISAAKTGAEVKAFMTSDMAKGYTKKMEEVFAISGEKGTKAIEEAFKNLKIDEKDPEIQKEIQSLIDATDWTNLESLKSLQIELQAAYGYKKEEVEAYIKVLGDAAYATSKLYTTIETFGDFYQANQRVEASLRKISELQREYNDTLENGQVVTKEILSEQLKVYRDLGKGYEDRYNASTTNLTRIAARGYDKTEFGTYNLWDYMSIREDGSLDTSIGASGLGIQDLFNSDETSADLEEKIKKFIEEYNTEWETQQESLDGLKDAADDIRELEQEGKDAYYELRDMVKDTILDAIQKQIDIQQDTLDATKTANANLINKIQEQIDYTRQQEQNRETEENIANLRSQSAYLGMDSSGANALQQAQLQKQIEQAEEDYLNTRIDQSIQSIQDANTRAEEQRERQIAIAEQQLEAYQNSPEFQQKTDEMLKELQEAKSWRNTKIGDLMYQNFAKGLSDGEAKDWQTDISNKIVAANGWKEGAFADAFSDLQEKINKLPTDLGNIINLGSNEGSLNKQITDLQSKHISADTLANLGVNISGDGSIRGSGTSGEITTAQRNQLDKVSQYLTTRDRGGTTAKSLDYLDKKGIKYSNEEKYYRDNIQKIASGEKVATYEEYLDKLVKDNKPTGGDFPGAFVADHYYSSDGWDTATINFNGEIIRDVAIPYGKGVETATEEQIKQIETYNGGRVPKQGWLSMVDEIPFVYWNGEWRKLRGDHLYNEKHNEAYRSLKGKMLNKLNEYKTGGIADFTGPAWLDGTPSKPEYVLNSAQTERFFSLIDVLEKYDTDESKQKSGDNYFDIEINVEKLENDYDVEKLANKIRSLIYNDATYRNVNAIHHIR